MANLKKKILGQVSGALGDLVFRERDGSNIIAVRPSSFNTPDDPASVARRGKFAMAAKLASAIGSNPIIKSLWLPLITDGLNIQSYLVKTNYFYALPDDITNLVKLVPDGGFGVDVVTVDKDQARVRVDINPVGENSGINIAVETQIQLLVLLFLGDPVDENNLPYSFLALSSAALPISLVDPLSFDTNLLTNQSLIYNRYQVQKAYFTIITLDAEDKAVHHSVTLNG